MTNDANFEKIETWLLGELPAAEARAFEAEIVADTTLAAEVERHRRGREALDRLAEQGLQGDMARWRESLNELPEPPADVAPTAGTASWLRWVSSGLLLLLMVGAAYWFWPSKNIQPGNAPTQGTIPQQPKPDVPVAEIAPTDQPANEIEQPKKSETSNPRRLIAMAETNLSDLQGAILAKYKDQRGGEDEENPSFTAGKKAFQSGNSSVAKEHLLQVPADDHAYFSSAQEMLALLYFQEKDYAKAARCYESYSSKNSDPAKDWRLLQFYLADYQNRKADFWKKLDEMTQPAYQPLNYRKGAIKLRSELGRIGIK